MKPISEKFELKTFNYSADFEKTDSPFKITDPSIDKKLQKVFHAVFAKTTGFLNQAEKFHKQHPDLPQAKNFLIKAYDEKGNTGKAIELNEQLLIDFPDYIFAKTNAAVFEYFKGNHEKMLSYLGESLNLEDLLPQRKIFHISELRSFIYATILYFIGTNQLNMAKKQLKVIEKMDPEHQLFQHANQLLIEKNMKNRAERYQFLQKRKEIIGENELPEQSSPAPVLEHPELQVLYEQEVDIAAEELQKILTLPRNSLIQDLEAILLDAIGRYEYFENETDYVEDTHSFPIHALFLLGELKAREALDTILYFFSMPERLLYYWLGDIFLDKTWQVIYYTGNHQLDKLAAFILNQKNYLFASSNISATVEQIVYHQPERRKEIITWYHDLLEKLLAKHQQGEVINTELVSFLVWDILNFKGKELNHVISSLFAEDLIETEMIGDMEQVLENLSSAEKLKFKRELQSIFEVYADLQTWGSDEDHGFEKDYEENNNAFHNDRTDEDSETILEDDHEQENDNPFIKLANPSGPAKVEKVGRNDPCPCGSGKKHKKCCMK